MGSIKGCVFYSQSSFSTILLNRIEIKNNDDTPSNQFIEASNMVEGIPVVLWCKDTKKGLCISTDNKGRFEFINVSENKTYKLVECFRQSASYKGQGNFNLSIDMNEPTPCDPTVEYIKSKGFETNNATRIVSLTQNVYEFKFTGAKLPFPTTQNIYPNTYPYCYPYNGQNAYTRSNNTYDYDEYTYPYVFCDAPSISIPLELGDYITIGDNLIKSVDNGTFGRFNYTTPAGNTTSSCPYEKYINTYTEKTFDTQFFDKYIKYAYEEPNGGKFTICNIANLHTFTLRWFDTPGYLQGDESGRFLIVNGDNPGKYFFKETVTVKMGSDYLFTAWIMNIFRLYNSGLPLFTVKVEDNVGNILYEINVSAKNPLNVTKIPTWKQIGAIIPSSKIGSNTKLTISFVSNGSELSGNDYCVDSISLYELKKCELIPRVIKSVNKTIAPVDESIEYSLTLLNETSSYIYNLKLFDVIPKESNLCSNMCISVNNISQTVFPIDEKALFNGVDISSLISKEVISNPNKYSSSIYYYKLKEGYLPSGLSITTSFSVCIKDISFNKIIRNTGRYEYLFSFDNYKIPRILISNEVETKIISPEISIKKEVSVFKDNVEVILPNGAGVFCGYNIAYRIIITNSGFVQGKDIKVSDSLDKILKLKYLSEKDKGISIQNISPVMDKEVFISHENIKQINNNPNNIELSNINVPSAIMKNDLKILGICIIRIYAKVEC